MRAPEQIKPTCKKRGSKVKVDYAQHIPVILAQWRLRQEDQNSRPATNIHILTGKKRKSYKEVFEHGFWRIGSWAPLSLKNDC